MLKLLLIGNLGRDAEIKPFENRSVIKFTVAHTQKTKDGEETTWVTCNYWRDNDKTKIAEYLLKGTKVYVEGTPKVTSYTNKAGEKAFSIELTVNQVELVGAKHDPVLTSSNKPPQETPAQEITETAPEADDLPF